MLTVTRMHAMSDLPDSQGFGLSPAAASAPQARAADQQDRGAAGPGTPASRVPRARPARANWHNRPRRRHHCVDLETTGPGLSPRLHSFGTLRSARAQPFSEQSGPRDWWRTIIVSHAQSADDTRVITSI